MEVQSGIWLVVTDDERWSAETARSWTDEETAIPELTAQGWDISGP